MGLSKPYYRIVRPGAFVPDYVVDKRYATDRIQLSRSYINIERSLRNIFDYIEPDEANKETFSFELYTLLLRACTEVELNCKQILLANGATTTSRHFTMKDYQKLESSSKLSKYKVTYRNWRRSLDDGSISYGSKEMYPFENFSHGSSPKWYADYNEVKHNREKNLKLANLDNCMNAVAGILVLLYSQFGSQCIESYGMNEMHCQIIGADDFEFDADVIFAIEPPSKDMWDENEKYDFKWDELKNQSHPFEKFNFNGI